MATEVEDDIDLTAGFRPHGSVHPAGLVTAFDETTGLPIVRRNLPHGETYESSDRSREHSHSTSDHRKGEKENADEIPGHAKKIVGNKPEGGAEVRGRDAEEHKTTRESRLADERPGWQENSGEEEVIPRKDAKTGRDILHRSTDRVQLVEQARNHAKQFEDGLKSATRGIAGAKFDAVRPEKTPARVDEKIHEEGQPINTIPDILAGRIGVDSRDAHERTVSAIKAHFKVLRDEDEFEQGSPPTNYRVHKLQVQVTPQLSAEAHIVPKEVLDANVRQHDVYEAARDAELEGKHSLAENKEGQAKAINDEAMAKFNERNATEHKYKFGNTQVNLHPDSDAYRAVRKMQSNIPKEHLANDGSKEGIDDPHVTVRYGLKNNDTNSLKDFLGRQPAFDVTIGKTNAFPVSDHSDGAVPIVVHVESPDMHRLNAEIEKHAAFAPSNFPEYKPHVTVGYLKPEHSSKYVGMDAGEGKTFRVDHVIIGDRDGNHERIPLGGAPAKLSKGVTVLIGKDGFGVVQGGNPNFSNGGRWSVMTPEGAVTKKGSELTPVAPPVMPRKESHWIGYDVDGSLAKWHRGQAPDKIGAPVAALVERAQRDIESGKDVRLFTAKISNDPKGLNRAALHAWSQRVFGKALPIQDVKDEYMEKMYDDRAIRVERNTGKLIG